MSSSFKEFIPLEKKGVEALLLQADFLYFQRKYEQAMEIYQSILKTDINHFEAMKRLGACLYFQKKYDSAIRCFEGAQKIQDNEECKVWLYASLVHLGKTKEAKNLLTDSREIELKMKEQGIPLDLY